MLVETRQRCLPQSADVGEAAGESGLGKTGEGRGRGERGGKGSHHPSRIIVCPLLLTKYYFSQTIKVWEKVNFRRYIRRETKYLLIIKFVSTKVLHLASSSREVFHENNDGAGIDFQTLALCSIAMIILMSEAFWFTRFRCIALNYISFHCWFKVHSICMAALLWIKL